MISFIMFWLHRFWQGVSPVVCPGQYQTIDYLAKSGWKPDFNFLKSASKDARRKYKHGPMQKV